MRNSGVLKKYSSFPMIPRFGILLLFLLFLSVPASGVNFYQLPDDSLTTAATKIIKKEYKGAIETALKSPPGGMRDFLLGMALVRTGEWEAAAEYLGKSAVDLPLLADYALYNRAFALYRLARYPESLATLQEFAKNYPESPLSRSVDKLRGDLLYDSGKYHDAREAYQIFIEKYASGADALATLHRLALCRERTGDTAAAVALLRNIWLKYPASAIAASAEEDLQRLADNGAKAPTYSAEELLRRGMVLSELRKYDKAIKTFNAISVEKQPDEFIWRLQLKSAQTLFKARHFKEAEQAFAGLLAKNPRRVIAEETRYWLAKSLDKNGKEEEAFALYAKLAESSPDSNLADDSLLAAAFIKKFQHKNDDELIILKMLVRGYPKSTLIQTAFWEIAWTSYQGGDLKTAADFFKKQLDNNESRERALYWYGRTMVTTGDESGAANAFADLLDEYPVGYYALSYKKEARIRDDETLFLSAELSDILSIPAGFERAKALIALGLYDEASKELSAAKRKSGDKLSARAGLARLYLEMGDYHAVYSLFRDGRLRNPDKNSLVEWGMAYPLAFREEVAGNAIKSGIPESLIYAIIRAESSYFPTALSPAGAVGLMQVMPATAAAVAKGGGEKCHPDQLTLPGLNIRLGVKHLHDLLTLYNGDIVMAIAAYNAGSGNVNRWLKTFGKIPREQFIENIPFPETREYVKKVLAGAEIYRRLYRLSPIPGPNRTTPPPVVSDIPPPRPAAAPMGTSRSTRVNLVNSGPVGNNLSRH
jgi:soluble lytic murein transglycosylase